MDTSTIIFILTLVIAFIVLRWLISPIPHSVAGEFNLPEPTQHEAENEAERRAPRERPARSGDSRQVRDSMIEVVQSIGPQLSVSQIRYSLQQTGSVEATVEQFMENGTLPYPPGETPQQQATEEHDHNKKPDTEAPSLLEKYHINETTDGNVGEEAVEGKWGKDKEERVNLLQKRKEEMILRARRRMKDSLSNVQI